MQKSMSLLLLFTLLTATTTVAASTLNMATIRRTDPTSLMRFLQVTNPAPNAKPRSYAMTVITKTRQSEELA